MAALLRFRAISSPAVDPPCAKREMAITAVIPWVDYIALLGNAQLVILSKRDHKSDTPPLHMPLWHAQASQYGLAQAWPLSLADVQQRLVLLSRDVDNHNGHRVLHQPTFTSG